MQTDNDALKQALQSAVEEKDLIKKKALDIVRRCKALEQEKEELTQKLSAQNDNQHANKSVNESVEESTAVFELEKYKQALEKAVKKLKSQKLQIDTLIEENNTKDASEKSETTSSVELEK